MPFVIRDWLAEHVVVRPDETTEQLAAALVRMGLEEEAIHRASVTGPVVVGRVLSREPEPQKNGKTINWCQVDVGSHNDLDDAGQPTVARGIVCGAHNFVEGDWVVVSLPGAVLPGGFAIAARKTYGHVSDGMICSAKELGLGEDQDGIIVLHRGDDPAEPDFAVGDDALELLGLNTETLEINVTPDRGYCFSVRGVAREYSHATGGDFTDPGLAANLSGRLPEPTADGFAVQVADDAPIHGVAGCDRFVTRIVRGVNPKAPTPRWMARRLEQAGMRSISIAVDVTNYVMLDLGQPLHAYDLAQVSAPIVVRRARAGETLTTLDDVERRLDTQDLLITDSPDGGEGSRVLGLAGVMGGASSEVTDATVDVLVEAAHFDSITVARTARRHKLPSEAAKRFERGVDPQLPPVAAQRVVDLLVEFAGGTADNAVSDLNNVPEPSAIALPLGEPARLVGVDYTREQIVSVLEQIGCQVAPAADNADMLEVLPPSWRPDLTGAAELVEEIARIIGYDQIVSVLPTGPAGRGLTRAQQLRRSVARTLAEHGLVETLTYPFVASDVNDVLDIPDDDPRRGAVVLRNPLGDDRPGLRTSILATLLDATARNLARGATDVAVFESGLVFRSGDHTLSAPALPGGTRPNDDELAALAAAIPDQPRFVAGVLVGNIWPTGWWGNGRVADYTDAIELARTVARRVGSEATVTATERAPWHPGRCAAIAIDSAWEDGQSVVIGHAGELHPKVLERLGLPARAVAFEIDFDALLEHSADEPVQADPVSTFPVTKEDLAFVVDESVTAAALAAAIEVGGGDLVESVRLFDIYRGEAIGNGKKSLAFALRLRAVDRTLTAEDAVHVREGAIRAAETLGAALRA